MMVMMMVMTGMMNDASLLFSVVLYGFDLFLFCTNHQSPPITNQVWLPAQQAYREISSISHCADFQVRDDEA